LSGIGPSELIVLVVVGLLILGPERLPRVATQIGRWVGRARRTANQLRYQLEREITLADIEGKKKKDQDKKEKDQESKPDKSATASDDKTTAADSPPPDSGNSDESQATVNHDSRPDDESADQPDDEVK